MKKMLLSAAVVAAALALTAGCKSADAKCDAKATPAKTTVTAPAAKTTTTTTTTPAAKATVPAAKTTTTTTPTPAAK
ncbi:MAG: hypothetical protein A2017_12435 [Lentisphaerae bacterium GWF2_44_16]|nr:MAG: hypothetical protein A2017_12435 [Lentisphaerae bacterium GWF2_44_16]